MARRLVATAAALWFLAGIAGPTSAVAEDTQVQAADLEALSWRSNVNASSVVRDPARGSGGALRWTATSTGNTRIENGPTFPASATEHTATITLSHNDTVGRTGVLVLMAYDSAGTYLGDNGGVFLPVPAGTDFTTISTRYTFPARTSQARVVAGIQGLPASKTAWLDSIGISNGSTSNVTTAVATPLPTAVPTPLPTAVPTPPTTAVGTPLRKWDYSTGDLSQWRDADGRAPVVVSDNPRRSMLHAARFTVTNGTRSSWDPWSVDRTEMSDYRLSEVGNPAPGTEQWWAFSTKFPSNLSAPSSFQNFHQHHQTGGPGSPPLWFNIKSHSNPARMELVVQGGNQGARSSTSVDLGVAPRGGWVDFRYYVRWSDTNTGRVILKMNTAADGSAWRTVADVTHANMYTGQSVYVKQGVYRSTSGEAQVWHHTGLRRGATEASVTY